MVVDVVQLGNSGEAWFAAKWLHGQRALDAFGSAGGSGAVEHQRAFYLIRYGRTRLRCYGCFPTVFVVVWAANDKAGGELRAGIEVFCTFKFFYGAYEHFGIAIIDNVRHFRRGEPRTDTGVVQPRPLRSPADLQEMLVVLHAQGDVVAGFQPQRTKQLCALDRFVVQLPEGHDSARVSHDVSGLVWCSFRLNAWVHHVDLSHLDLCFIIYQRTPSPSQC